MTIQNDQEVSEEVKNQADGAPPPQDGKGSGASSSDVKNDVKPEAKELSTEERLEKYEREYKGIDLNRYEKMKDIDFDEYQDMKSFMDAIDQNPELEEQILKIFEDFKAGKLVKKDAGSQAPSREEKPGNSPKSEWETRVSRLEERIYQEDMNRVISEFDKSFDKEIKSLDLTEKETKLLKRAVEDAYIHDTQSGRPKLSLNDLPSVVKTKFAEEIDSLRKDYLVKLGKSAKEDSPQPLKGGSSAPTGTKPENPPDRHSRVAAIREELYQKSE
jgi:hypothetical protein